MARIMPATNMVGLDEPCYGLAERVYRRPDSRGFHRYRLIFVIRDDAIAEFRQDMGPASAFSIQEFFIPGGVTHRTTGRIEIVCKVGELIDVAEGLHAKPLVPSDSFQQVSDLAMEYYDTLEDERKWARGHSTFGPLVRVQRS